VSWVLWATSCVDPIPPSERPPATIQAAGIPQSPLDVEGGTVLFGIKDGLLTVSEAPANAEIDLYLSRAGEGPQDCVAFAPICIDLIDAELYATATASSDGIASFVID
jgi:hypothetical protein